MHAAPLKLLALALCGLSLAGCKRAGAGQAGETIVLVRHGEKPPAGLGQLSCRGLNRSLALPNVLIGRYGPADAIYAPNPADGIYDEWPRALEHKRYSYVRPLATIEPTAIQLGLPVNTQIGYSDIRDLEKAVTAPAYAHSTVYIAWEHVYAERFGKDLLRSYGLDPARIPRWPNDDYGTIYVFRIAPRTPGAALGAMTFSLENEGLDASLSDLCPDQQTR